MKRRLKINFAIPISLLLFVATTLVGGHAQEDKQLQRRISEFQADNVPASLALQRLAKTADLPIGIEAPPEETTPKTIAIEVRNTTVHNILDAVTAADPRYGWAKADSVVNVFPKAGKDPFLEIVVPQFEVKNVTRVEAIRLLQKSPNVKAKLSKTGVKERSILSLPADTESALPRFSLSVRNSQVRTILNDIMMASRSTHWMFFRYGDHNEYFSLTMR